MADSQRVAEDVQLERKMKEMLQVSIFELKNTAKGLEKRLDSVEEEGNEWKTRYETQTELNKQIERQILLIQQKSEQIRGSPADRLSSIRSYDQMPTAALNKHLKHLDEEKALLENQIKDFQLRLEQETKAYYKVNDERRMYMSELSQTSITHEAPKKQQNDPAHIAREKQKIKAGQQSLAKQKTVQKKEPVKKTSKINQASKTKH
ncbi:coiled-coil domain-containing protein 169 [Pelobates fuscus]|uniref:coiled-coil domain-containing protein 169 n=1 Tax=Pelobates fuscus TaxID=191477 RepID=UPI002FE45DEC